MNYIEKIKKEKYNLPSCCKNYLYDNETESCLRKNDGKYPFEVPCIELVPLDEADLKEIQPEDVLK